MATATIDFPKDEFRVCPDTSFRVYKRAEPLMIVNAVAAILCLAIGGTAALLMGLHKLPIEWSPLGSDTLLYYRIVSIHGVNMLILWIVFFEVAAMFFVSTALLNTRLASVPLGWVSFALMLVGALMLEYSLFFDKPGGGYDSIVMFTAYFPLKATPIFYLGYILFAVGVLVAAIVFFWTIYLAKKTLYADRSLPLTVYGVFVAVVIAVQAILNGAIVMVLALLYSLDILKAADVDADFWKQVFWGFGHTAQYINIAATAAIWYALIYLVAGAKPMNEKFSRFAFLLYLIFTVPVATHHLIVDPAYSMPFKLINATILALGLAVPSLIHAFVIPGALEKKMREDGKAGEGLFGWFKNLPWNEPGMGALFWSVFLFGFGGMLGSIQGTYQLNLITHNTLRINAHFHLTVVAATTIAFMGLSYYFMQLIPRRKLLSKKLAVIQPHIYGIGLGILATGLFIAGVQGAPRRTATYENYDPALVAQWGPGLWLLGIGAVIAVTAGALYVLLMVGTLFFGEKLPKDGDANAPLPGLDDSSDATSEETHEHKRFEAPSIVFIGLGFMVIFAVFYITTFLILALNGWYIGPNIPNA